MRFAKALAALVLIPIATAHGDELVLKDGKTVTWTQLSDLGDTYEVTTPDGLKLEIKKSDVATFVPKDRARIQKEKALAPLTGATFTWEKGMKLQEYDLLKAVDLKRDAVLGEWKYVGRALQGAGKLGTGWARLETTYVPPAEYDFTIVLERVEGEGNENGFCLTMPGATGTQFGIFIGHKGLMGATVVDGKWPGEGGLGIKEYPFTKNGQQRTVIVMIRKFGFALKLDGKDLVAWTGEWSRVTRPAGWGVEKEKSITLINTVLKPFRIHQAVVTFPKQ